MRRNTRILLCLAISKRKGERRGRTATPRLSALGRRRRIMSILMHWIALRRRRDCLLRKRRKQRRWWIRPILAEHDTHGAWASLIPLMRESDPEEFYNFHRCSIEDFDHLVHLLYPHLAKHSMRNSISVGERLSITLRYLSAGEFMTSLKFLYRVSTPCISQIIRETCYALWYALKPEVFPRLSVNYWLSNAADFEAMWQFPHCIGAVGKHCAFQAFPTSGSENYNYKGFHSLNLMAVCDAKYRFISVDVGANGRRNDNDVFHNSIFGTALEQGALQIPSPSLSGSHTEMPFVLVGDGIFTLSKNLLIPFPGEFIPPEERIFNYRLSRARRVVENAFGVLSARYRILRKSIISSLTTGKGIILACCALHNFHLANEENLPAHLHRYMPPQYVDHYRSDGRLIRGRWRNEDKVLSRSIFQRLIRKQRNPAEPASSDGFHVRESFMEYFIDHSLPWQWTKIAAGRRR